jgi:hypothetical protein
MDDKTSAHTLIAVGKLKEKSPIGDLYPYGDYIEMDL